MTDGTPDLASLCEELAEGLDDVSSTTDGEIVTYTREGNTFARANVSLLEVHLPADIAEAAMRTPDTTAAEAGWLRFSPRAGESHVVDRAEAWFHTAWRHASTT
jgi:hypothetical protein